MDSPHILLVDDDTALLQALPHMVALRIHGVRVDTSDSAFQALEQIRERDYDAIVSDIKMPGMDGLELLARIQELRPETPTLLITGHAEQELVTQALRGGAYDFIQKPIDRVSFVAALHRAIQTYQLRRQVREQQRALAQHAQALERILEQRTHELRATHEAMDSLVRDLLDCTLIQAGEFALHPTRCDLVELCQQVLQAYTEGAGLALTFEFEAVEPLAVSVDRERMNQVLVHLLSNARKYSPAGTPITVTLRRAEAEVILSVHDAGPGISQERLAHIFDQYARVPEVEMRAGQRPAVGLGLYLSRHIVEQHGGHFEVQSCPGEGSTFSVVLPSATDTIREDARSDQPAGHEPSLFPPPKWLVS